MTNSIAPIKVLFFCHVSEYCAKMGHGICDLDIIVC